jgi:hypothetical protein
MLLEAFGSRPGRGGSESIANPSKKFHFSYQKQIWHFCVRVPALLCRQTEWQLVEFHQIGERLIGSAEEGDIRATPEIVWAWERKKRVAELRGSDPFELLPHQDCELTRYAHEITLVQLKRSEAVKANIAVQMRPYGRGDWRIGSDSMKGF